MNTTIKFRRHHRNIFQAIVTDEEGRKWVWSEPIYEREAEYQGPMGMLGSTHKTTAYDIEGYGTVPESLRSTRIVNYIKERFIEHPEEFEPFYPLHTFKPEIHKGRRL